MLMNTKKENSFKNTADSVKREIECILRPFVFS